MPMLERATPPNVRVIDETKLYPRTPSGLLEGQNVLYRYGYSESKYPILRIVDYISDYNGKYLKPGIYELALSDDKEFLLFIQSGELMAVIPVFKLAENQEEVERYRKEQSMKTNKLKYKPRKYRMKERIQKVLAAKYAEDAITPEPEEYVYQNATIEYISEGGYYLVTYENGMYRAWGAIKTRAGFDKIPPQNMRGKTRID